MPAPALPLAIIGGGPAGLIAAEILATAGEEVIVFERMPTVGRKFLLAGRGGLNLTHSEALEHFLDRYGERRDALENALRNFPPQALRDWVHGLGIDTFTGSSGRVFPTGMKAAPLLRAWLARLRALGVRFAPRHRWLDWQDTGTPSGARTLRFATPEGERCVEVGGLLLAVGGASWSRFGSDGRWTESLQAHGLQLAPFRPANCGFDVGGFDVGSSGIGRPAGPGWSAHFRERFRGAPLKSVSARFIANDGQQHVRSGECMISAHGIEGGLIYALSAALRDQIENHGAAALELDLAPGRELTRLQRELARPRGSRSLSTHLQAQAGIKGVKAGLLREVLAPAVLDDPARLARAIKALPLPLIAPRPLDEAISCAGGLALDELDAHYMLRRHPGVFAAGEMLDWEAPTGGYLLTACFATGIAAARGLLHWRAGQLRG